MDNRGKIGMELVAGRLSDERIADGYALILDTRQWLEQHNRKQRVADTSYECYQRWQSTGGNYAVFDGTRIAGIFTVVTDSFVNWPEFSKHAPAPWLRALVTHSSYRGMGVGAVAIAEAVSISRPGNLFLDCVSGFLPGYYQGLGFQTLAQRKLADASGTMLGITLMKHGNPDFDPTSTWTRPTADPKSTV